MLLNDAIVAQLERRAAAAGANAARLVAVEGFKRQKLSVTTSKEVGAQLLADQAPQQILPLRNTKLPHWVDQVIKPEWETITNEDGVQVWSQPAERFALDRAQPPSGNSGALHSIDVQTLPVSTG